MQVVVDEKKKTVTIILPLQAPAASASGKTMVIATTRGNKESDATYKGNPIVVGCNAYYKP